MDFILLMYVDLPRALRSIIYSLIGVMSNSGFNFQKLNVNINICRVKIKKYCIGCFFPFPLRDNSEDVML